MTFFRPQDDTPPDPATAVSVGRITMPHGIKGEVKVQPLTDFHDRFDRGARLWLDGRSLFVERSRWQENNVLLKLQGVETRTDAEALRGKELFVSQARTIFDKDRYYLHDIIGLPVVDTEGTALGVLEDVLSTGANDVYVVRGDRGELLLPAVEDVVKEVDLPGRRIVVDLLPGLEFQPPRAPRPPKRSKPASR